MKHRMALAAIAASALIIGACGERDDAGGRYSTEPLARGSSSVAGGMHYITTGVVAVRDPRTGQLLKVAPAPPQVNLFHLHFQAPAEALTAARDRIAAEDGAWLAPRFSVERGTGRASAEIYAGESLLTIPRSDDRGVLAPLYARMLALAHTGATAQVR